MDVSAADVQALIPTPQFSHRGDRGRRSVENGGGETLHAATINRLWPTISAASSNQGPGRQGRDGGPNLRTAIAEQDKPGPLSPHWVSWLQGVPVGWVDLECENPIQLDWLSEYGIPRVQHDVPMRRQQLQALGNALVHQVAFQRYRRGAKEDGNALMGEILAYRDLSPQQRIGGFFSTLEDLENYVRFLSFDVFASDVCGHGWFCVPASVVEQS